MTVIVVAAVGVVINLATALLFMSGRKGDLNVRAAFQHMAGDAAIALGVVIAGVAILYTGWHWLDPVVSLVIAVLVIFGTWGLLRDSVALALDAVPAGVDFEKVRGYPGLCAGRLGGPRPAHLGHEHDRDGADGASRLSGRLPRRRQAHGDL